MHHNSIRVWLPEEVDARIRAEGNDQHQVPPLLPPVLPKHPLQYRKAPAPRHNPYVNTTMARSSIDFNFNSRLQECKYYYMSVC